MREAIINICAARIIYRVLKIWRIMDSVNYDGRLRDNYDVRRIDSSELQLVLTCCLT
jgi:hypothetical protein